ncbi:MAG: GH92 family glycosyl hydrolase [Bacteroidales bacterium]
MSKFRFISALFLMGALTLSAQKPDLVKYVNTLQGTNSEFKLTRGNTYPTTALPFAQHTWTAQTGINGDGWKYQYPKDSIRGFQQAHQCSSWTNDYHVFSLMPVTGVLAVDQYKRAAKFSHDNEIAKPHFYKVKFDNGITTEMSTTERGAHIRFSFPSKGASFVVFDGYTRTSTVNIDPSKRRITGYVSNGGNPKDGFKNYYIVEFDQPFVSYGTWDGTTGEIKAGNTTDGDKKKGAYIEFKKGAKVQVKVISSYISPEQAELNFQRELAAQRTQEETRNAAYKVWNDHLNRVLVSGGTEEEKATFYSCFFRANLFTRVFYELDKDGNPYYFSPNDFKVYPGYYYTDTGFWDTFRGQFPLNALLHPTMHGRYVNSLLAMYDQWGWLPSWAFPGEQGGMVGNHAISLFADAWVKGLRTFDPAKALEAYFHEATNKGPRGPSNGRDGWKDYWTLGYVAYPGTREATAKTLEYAYDDFCAYVLAKATGNKFYEEIFARQMYNYRNVFNKETGFMQGRMKNGEWTPDFDPIEWGGPFTEGCAWHYLWSVFQDIEGLSTLLGGNDKLVEKLDGVFSATNEFKVGTYGFAIHEMTEMKMINMGQYAHGNQPIQHMPYLYNFGKAPWKSQQKVREIMAKLYNSTENGYPGDEDQGQTSSWYVLSAMGFYSVCPGTDQYVIGSPLFPKMTITMESGKQLVIEAENNSPENVYIQSASLNGVPFTRNYVTYQELTNGGTLKFVMGPQPNKQRGVADSDKPFSLQNGK